MPLTSSVRLAVAAKLAQTLDLGEAIAPSTADYSLTLADGIGAGQADAIFADRRTLLASASEDLDLAGVLTDPLGEVLTFAKVKALIVAASASNTHDVIVGGAATTAFAAMFGAATDTVVVRPGGALALVTGAADGDGYAVAAGASDLLKVANGGAVTAVTYDVIVIGASA